MVIQKRNNVKMESRDAASGNKAEMRSRDAASGSKKKRYVMHCDTCSSSFIAFMGDEVCPLYGCGGGLVKVPADFAMAFQLLKEKRYSVDWAYVLRLEDGTAEVGIFFLTPFIVPDTLPDSYKRFCGEDFIAVSRVFEAGADLEENLIESAADLLRWAFDLRCRADEYYAYFDDVDMCEACGCKDFAHGQFMSPENGGILN